MTDVVPISGFPGYRVSSDGVVHGRRGALRPFGGTGGYLRVDLWQQGHRTQVKLHKLVAEAFLPPRPSPTHEIAHNDGDRNNNAATNLRWATRQENVDDRTRHNTTARGERIGRAILTTQEVLDIRAEYAAGGVSLAALGRRYGVSYMTISSVVTRRTWTHI